MTCDDLLDKKLKEAISSAKNLVFETVGTYYPGCLINE